jgi:conjugative relaxase-like TrwC/TraI family protein
MELIFLRWANLSFCGVDKIRSARGAAEYAMGNGPTAGTQDDYYKSENIGHDGIWYDPDGMLKEFGISHGSKIEYDDLLSLLEGKDPRTGDSIFGDNHMPGTELVMSVPKSVSAILAIADDELRDEIGKATLESNQDGLDFVDDNASYTRMGKGGLYHTKSHIAAAVFSHGSSRGASNELGGDPHRHMHNLCLNMTKCEDGKWRTLENSYLHEYQKAIGAQFRASLAFKLEKLGFEIERTPDGAFQIPGVPKDLVKHWSSRREQMKFEAAKKGVSTGNRKEMAKLQQSTRRSKIVKYIGDLVNRWKDEARQFGFTEHSVKKLTEVEKVKLSADDKKNLISNQVRIALNNLVETESVFTRAQMITEISEQLTGVLDDKEIMKEVEKAIRLDEIVHLTNVNGDLNRKVYMSTKDQIAIEKSIPELAIKLFSNGKHVIQSSIIEATIKSKNGISEEQADAVRHALSDGSLKVIVGDAGVGKTFSSSAIKDSLEAAGYKVIALAPTWKAVKGVEQELDLAGHAKAIQGVINDYNKGKFPLSKNDALIIDEAGMTGSRTTHALLKIAEETGCKIILMGDHKQLNAIEAGAGMKIILDHTHHARISTIRRQNEVWAREMVTNLANGRTDEAIKLLDNHNGISYVQDDRKLKMQLIADWRASTIELGWTPENSIDSDKSHLIIAVKNDDVFTLNEMVREVLRERNLLYGDDIKVQCQPLTQDGEPVDMSYAVGDRVVLRLNEFKQLNVTNRDEGLITKIELARNGGYDFHLNMDDGSTKIVNTKTYVEAKSKSFAATHGYAVTTYSSQGMTNRRVFAVADGMGQRYGYIALSRHKESVKLYVNERSLRLKVADRERIKPRFVTNNDIKQQLVRQLSRKTDKLSTLDFEVNRITKENIVDLKLESINKVVDKIQEQVKTSLNSMKKSVKELSEFVMGKAQGAGKIDKKPSTQSLQELKDAADRLLRQHEEARIRSQNLANAKIK